MSNSPLVNFTRISPNKTSPRKHKIDTVTIHCVVGQQSPEVLGAGFASSNRQASSNYGIGPDGRIGMYVEEKDRSWCSSNSENDDRAITIEVASDTTHPYAVTDAAYKALIDLLVDICQRNGIKELLWKNDKSLIGQVDKQNMTVHRWFAAKECPGEYLFSRHAQIAAEVNTRLKSSETPEVTEPPVKENTDGYTKIAGIPVATIEQMTAHIKKKNPNVAQSVIDMIPFYISEGNTEGIRGDIAFAQSCLETGNFSFPQSSCAVTLSQNNFAMMGVTSTFEKGNSYETPQIGIRAQIQHLKAYASTEKLVGKCVDPRFTYVTRGCAPYVEWLGMKENPKGKGWASAKNYGTNILKVLNEICKTTIESKPDAANTAEKNDTTFGVGDLVSISTNAKYSTGAVVPDWVRKKNWYIKSISGDCAIIDKSEDGVNSIKSPINVSYLKLVKVKSEVPYTVKVEIPNLNIRKGPGVDYAKTGFFTGIGIFTIVEVKNGDGSNSGWGRLKSGAGWISLDHTKKV